jgi:hypothetical protein
MKQSSTVRQLSAIPEKIRAEPKEEDEDVET